ncbi:Tas retrotransposon peptidase A16 [Ancylostoma duodenale]|uniref:Tas retrotransposon peptidase A16 n=1 Tax=Ancylostoma duodenale TaxID=51022 RepID=A0A0C2FDS4_9BILA|nr:Tas retrotransposon peptidase A16 [Ancylostoma duodenale]
MYCEGSHKSSDCDKFKPPFERLQYLRSHKLCLICASSQHTTTECKRRQCFKCQKRHHTSCCFQSATKAPTPPPAKRELNDTNRTKETSTKRKEPRAFKPVTKVNQISQESNLQEEKTVLEIRSGKYLEGVQTTLLPTGEVTVMDPVTEGLRKIPVLFDRGDEISFIDTALADKLRLPTIKETKLHLQTFGSRQVQETRSRKVSLQIWDAEGKPFSLLPFTHDILIKPFVTAPVCAEDVEFLRQQHLPVNLTTSRSTVKPSILLGCDQLWTLLKNDLLQVQLPSGLYLLPTRIGHSITGQVKTTSQMDNHEDEIDKWDGYWTLEGRVNVASTSIIDTNMEANENEKWEKYWSLESAGTQEFSSSKKEEKAKTDRQVWERFNQSIKKREDGYYVRLAWKNVNVSLPDSRAIALSRLVNMWNSLQKDENLLERYNDIFKEQLRQHIL